MIKKFFKKALNIIGLFTLLIITVLVASYLNAPTEKDLKAKEISKKLGALVDACDRRIKLSVINKSTLDISTFGGNKWQGDDGRYHVTRIFTAKNKFNLEQQFRATCIEDANRGVVFDVEEVVGG
ncbi:MAG: hypothetical protein E6556_20740 [Pantoea sp.]|jgi:hypothetical protein|nr:hypothetical protein [Pantoea sp.]